MACGGNTHASPALSSGDRGEGQTSGVGPPAATLSTEGVEVDAGVITSTSCLGMAVSQASNSAAPIRWASRPARPQEATPPDAHALLVCCFSRGVSRPCSASSKATVWWGSIRCRRHLQPQPRAHPRSPPPRRARVLGRLLGRFLGRGGLGVGGRAPLADASPHVGSTSLNPRQYWAAVAVAAAALGFAGSKQGSKFSIAVQEQAIIRDMK